MQGFERRATAQASITPAVHELQSLRDELDLANPAGTELDVAIEARAGVTAVDLRLHLLDLFDGREIEEAAVDEGADLLEERPAEVEIASDRARLQHGGALPRLAERLVVDDRRGKRVDDRPVLTLGAQPQGDTEDESLDAHFAQHARRELGNVRS